MLRINKKILVGPFIQILAMDGLPAKGPLKDKDMPVLFKGGIIIDDQVISKLGDWKKLKAEAKAENWPIIEMNGDYVATPGLIDCHTHICYAGSRARDYAMRNAGSSYLEIAASGGGIMDTVSKTRAASLDELIELTSQRAKKLLRKGITTIEVKSGYGLSVEQELKMLEVIQHVKRTYDLVPTCLAAHIVPKEYKSDPKEYVSIITEELLPMIHSMRIAKRVDAFIEKEAYTRELILPYLNKAKELGFDITLHADQFSSGGSQLAIEFDAVSADHLEAIAEDGITRIAESNVVAVALPGASLGLGCAFTPARKILDQGGSVAIASDYNPGSAPMGDLLTQASILGTFQKLSNSEVLAGITIRAAHALKRANIGKLKKGMLANITIWPTHDFNEILYHQGQMEPSYVIYKGKLQKK